MPKCFRRVAFGGSCHFLSSSFDYDLSASDSEGTSECAFEGTSSHTDAPFLLQPLILFQSHNLPAFSLELP